MPRPLIVPAGRRWRVLGLVAGLTFAAVACAPADDPSPIAPELAELPDLVARSGWIFEGTIVALHASNQGAPDPARAIVVRIDRVSVEPLEAPAPPGTLDTIELVAPPEPGLAVGSRAYFFVGGQQAGVHWLFAEVGHLDSALLGFDELHARVHAEKRALIDRALYDRLIASERVLRATVIAIDDVADGPGPLDAADWWVATVQPRNTLRGPVEVEPLAVRFARNAGGDGPGLDAPARLEVGVECLLLLHPDTVSGHGPGLLVEDARDVQPTGELERLRSLLASPPGT